MHSGYLIAHVAANVVAFFFDEACKLLELGFLFCHAGQYTMPRTRAIVQPSGSMWPFRFRAWSSPRVRTRRRGAEILPMDSLRTSSKQPTPSTTSSKIPSQFRSSLNKDMLRRSNEALEANDGNIDTAKGCRLCKVERRARESQTGMGMK
jgi:hypothetical protein